jgi:hypothetical protein
MRGEDHLHAVERAGADVTEHDAGCGQNQDRQAATN